MKTAFLCLVLLTAVWNPPASLGETVSLEARLERIDVDVLAQTARQRGDAHRGALVYFTSAAGCVQCHQDGETSPALGPNLTMLASMEGSPIADEDLVRSLLHPSQSIRDAYRTQRILTVDGEIRTGMLVREDATELVLRDAANLEMEITVPVDDIEARTQSDVSMMPDGIVASLRSEREFLDLVRYLIELVEGGPAAAQRFKPSAEQLAIRDDTSNLNHAALVRESESGNVARGKQIYQTACINCHGADGNRPALATARAFGTQPLKFGADPYRMFMTLTKGNGLMAATTDLSPRERYQVIGYIRQHFMRDSNPDYIAVTDDYLAALPEGTEMGDFEPDADRDYGPALASQLGREVSSALTIDLGDLTISYDLHSMDQADIWHSGFLNVDQTQHKRGRGEGYAEPRGVSVDGLQGWQWAHDGTFDYPTESLRPRGPMPSSWMHYDGHSLHDDSVVMRYSVERRKILDMPESIDSPDRPDSTDRPSGYFVRHALHVGPGDALMLSVAQGDSKASWVGVTQQTWEPGDRGAPPPCTSPACDAIAVALTQPDAPSSFTAAKVLGQTDDMTWTTDDQHRLVLNIPRDTRSRTIEICIGTGQTTDDWSVIADATYRGIRPDQMLDGGNLRWPNVLSTVGYLGFQTGAYAVDTITVPDATPWNTWFRTSAIDFFDDGRMAVATVGGDVWIVSGVDDELLDIRWKRFAGGLYEPFGIKVVDGVIYVTCKDRLTRLHDINGDGEADFYESFHADEDVSTFFHAFNFDLQVDSHGNFHYAKSGQYTDYRLPGSVVQISPDGKQQSIVCTGFRTPNGMGILPNDRLTVSDNQGNWMPASKISLIRKGGFYGYVQNKRGGAWAPDGGKIDIKKVVPPAKFDPPMIWMPQHVDNSSGGQLWVDDPRWGPLSGRLLHTSFGQGALHYLMMQDVGDETQAALIRFPHDFRTGIMRARTNPFDGQVYVTGLNGWNNNGRAGLADNGIERVRYTGKPIRMVTDCQVRADGLSIELNFEIDPSIATDVSRYQAQQWNYRWTSSYGSGNYHPETDEPGEQELFFESVAVSEDGRSILLQTPEIQPVDQLHLSIDLIDAEGKPFAEDIYWTIHGIPSALESESKVSP